MSLMILSAFLSLSGPAAASTILNEFFEGASPTVRRAMMLPPDAADRRQWRRDPSPRPGVMLRDLDAGQKAKLDRLFRTVLSEKGLATVLGIRKEQNILGREESGLGEDYYWFAVYGQPGEGRWAWRLGGHHVSVHAAYDGERLRSAGPMFLGGNDMGGAGDRFEGYERLSRRDLLTRQIGALASDRRFAGLKIEGPANNTLEWSEPMRPIETASGGMALTKLDEGGRAKVEALAREFIEVYAPPVASQLQEIFDRGKSGGTVGFRGSTQKGQSYYLRIHVDGLLIECGNSGNHMHSILRTKGDFGE